LAQSVGRVARSGSNVRQPDHVLGNPIAGHTAYANSRLISLRKCLSLFFKKMHIVRGCVAKRNVLVYLSYTDMLIEGSPQNSTSTVPIMPWQSAGAQMRGFCCPVGLFSPGCFSAADE
jgi:hypothetical protein